MFWVQFNNSRSHLKIWFKIGQELAPKFNLGAVQDFLCFGWSRNSKIHKTYQKDLKVEEVNHWVLVDDAWCSRNLKRICLVSCRSQWENELLLPFLRKAAPPQGFQAFFLPTAISKVQRLQKLYIKYVFFPNYSKISDYLQKSIVRTMGRSQSM